MFRDPREYYTVGIGWTMQPFFDWPDKELRPSAWYKDQPKSEHCYHVDELNEAAYGENPYEEREEERI